MHVRPLAFFGWVFATALFAGSPAPAPPVLRLPLERDLNDAAGRAVVVRHRGITFRDGAAWFDGQDSELVLPAQPLARKPFAIAFWVKFDGEAAGWGLVAQKSANARNQQLHLVIRDHKPRLGFYGNDLQSSVAVVPGRDWTHLVFEYTGDEQRIWVNGRAAGNRTARPFLGTGGEFIIGRAPRWANVPALDFRGGLRDFRLYDRALDAREVATLFGGEATEPAAALARPPVLLASSQRVRLAPGDVVTSGVVVAGRTPRRVLFRAAGQGAESFAATVGNRPRLEIVSGQGVPAAESMPWEGGPDAPFVRAVQQHFPVPKSSATAALIVTLPPGRYTVNLTDAAAFGEVLLEAFLLD